MLWILLVAILFVGGTYAEKSQRPVAARIRSNRIYQGGRSRVINVGKAVRGRPLVYKSAKPVEERREPAPPPESPRRMPRDRTPLPYTAPEPRFAEPGGTGRPSGGITVDFFEAILHVANAVYEGPNDALRVLRTFSEGSRSWAGGMTIFHQRMSDPGDMNIDPWVSDHVIRAVAFIQAAGLELAEADAAFARLMNMTLAELTERGLRIPKTHH